MEKVASFEKVSFAQFLKDYQNAFPHLSETEIEQIYQQIKIPNRATTGSAGYDFYLPQDITLKANEEATIITGIRSNINEGWVLMLYPRSSLGFKYCLRLHNSVGIIDSDYYNSDNEGHIFARIGTRPYKNSELHLPAGSAFMQGLFLQFGIIENDYVTAIRNGGIGSTNNDK